jgi:hypothetical protein
MGHKNVLMDAEKISWNLPYILLCGIREYAKKLNDPPRMLKCKFTMLQRHKKDDFLDNF